MEIVVSKRFLKQLEKCPVNIQVQTRGLLVIARNANNIEELPDVKKMAGYKEYYRIRVGGWRIGLKLEAGIIKVLFVMTILPRGDMYKHFPPK